MHPAKHSPIARSSGIFLSVCGFGGLLSIWAVNSVFVISNYEPWILGLAAALVVGLLIFTHTNPKK